MANEKRLIDANALKERLKNLEAHGGHNYYRKGMDEALHTFMPHFIDDAPTVDAVEVPCRCCDCYYLLNSINSFGVYFFCGHRNGLKNLHNTEKDFCPYGKERHEDGK